MTARSTATSRPSRSTADMVLACLVWSLVLATAALEMSLLTAVTPKPSAGAIDKIAFYLSGAMFQAFWILCLISERIDRYRPRKVRFVRRLGWITQGCFFALVTAGTWSSRHPLSTAVGLFLLVLAKMLWRARASSEALHPDDQKIVDGVVAEEERLLAEQFRAEVARIRESRLTEALNSVRRFTVAEPSPEPAAPLPPNITWDIPKGTHTPVVYFIRNGNRIKIGTTTDLHQRVRRLSLRFEDVALVLPGGRDVERSTHRQFTSVRVGNTEWFRDEQPLRDFITNQADRRMTTSTKGSDSHG